MVQVGSITSKLLSCPRALFVSTALGVSVIAGCGQNANIDELPPASSIQAESVKDEIPDVNGIFLSSVDQALVKAELGKIKSAKLYINTNRGSTSAYYEFLLENGNKAYLSLPNDPKEIERLEQGLRTLGNKPIYITKGAGSSTETIVSWSTAIIPPVLVSTLMLTLIIYYRRMIKGGKEGLKPEKPNTKFSDVRGYPAIVKRLEKVVKYIKDEDKNKVKAELPKGVLLIGPPGTGKTLMARAVAGESDIPIIVINTSGLMQMIGGVGVAKLKEAFKVAENEVKKYGQCIIFLDELDSVGAKRTNATDGVTDERVRILTFLLTKMDGFKPNSGIMIMAATNRADILDPALVSRFTLQIDVPLPISSNQREDILDRYLSKKQEENLLAEDVDIKWLADNTEGFSGRDLENLVIKAALIAFEQEQSLITRENFKEAITEINIGMESGAQVKGEHRKVIAVHEPSGHGLLGMACKRRIDAVSSMPRGPSLGHVMFSGGLYNKVLPNRTELLESLLILMGGRAAELELLPESSETTGAGADYREARNIIRIMLNSAMFPGHVANDYSDPSKELTDEDREFATRVLDKALLVSREIIKTAPEENLRGLVAEYLGLDEELTGEQAEALFTKHLKDINWESIYKLVEGFKEEFGNKPGK